MDWDAASSRTALSAILRLILIAQSDTAAALEPTRDRLCALKHLNDQLSKEIVQYFSGKLSTEFPQIFITPDNSEYADLW